MDAQPSHVLNVARLVVEERHPLVRHPSLALELGQVLRGETLTYHRIGGDRGDNMAVMQLAAERPWDRPASIEVFASIGSFRTGPSTVDVQLSVDGQVRSIQELEVPAATSEGPGRRSLVFSPFE